MHHVYPIVSRDTGKAIAIAHSSEELEQLWAKHEGENTVAVTNVDEACKLSLSAMVECYNHLAGTSLKKFESKEAGARRLIKFLQPTMKKEAAMATKRKKTATKKTATKKTATKKTKARKMTADDGAATSVAATFRKYIIGGLDKETTLKMVRKAFPDRDVPDAYYAWYKNDCKKKGLINEDG